MKTFLDWTLRGLPLLAASCRIGYCPFTQDRVLPVHCSEVRPKKSSGQAVTVQSTKDWSGQPFTRPLPSRKLNSRATPLNIKSETEVKKSDYKVHQFIELIETKQYADALLQIQQQDPQYMTLEVKRVEIIYQVRQQPAPQSQSLWQ